MASNKPAFETRSAVESYAQAIAKGLLDSEKIAFRYLDNIPHETVLDIGVGVGRTIPFLSSIFGTYIGIDYSEPLVHAARERFPERQLLVMDARELSFPHTFDAIVFSYNGLDYIDEDDRLGVIDRISSHLRPGGLFIYSTHNLGCERVEAWLRYFWVKELGFGRAIVRRLPQRLLNYWKQRRCGEFAYVNDPGLGFSLLTRYGDILREMEILRRMDLSPLATIGASKKGETFDHRDSWVYLVSKKTGNRDGR